jgi:hypothetical protein
MAIGECEFIGSMAVAVASEATLLSHVLSHTAERDEVSGVAGISSMYQSSTAPPHPALTLRGHYH